MRQSIWRTIRSVGLVLAILIGLALTLLGVGPAQAQVACQEQLVNRNLDAGLAPWVAVAWAFGGPQFTAPGALFHFGNPAFQPNSLSQALGAPAFASSIGVKLENGDGPVTWDFSVGYTSGAPTVTSMAHAGPGDGTGFPCPSPACPTGTGGIWVSRSAAFDPFRQVSAISISQISGLGSPTCTDNYSLCGYRARDIDIKPGSFPNSINPGSKGRISVCLLSEPGFDATTSTSLTFGPSNAPALQTAVEDCNSDGVLDLVAHFSTQATGISCSTTAACLTASSGGVATRGCDSVNPVPCP